MKATLYKIRTYEALMNGEIGIRYWTHIPKDTCYYKHELLGEYEIELEDDIEVVKQKCTGIPTFWHGKEYLEFCTQDDTFCLIGENWIREYQPVKR